MELIALVLGRLDVVGDEALTAWRARAIDPGRYQDWPEGDPLFSGAPPAARVGELFDTSLESDQDASFLEVVREGDARIVRGVIVGEARVLEWTLALATAFREAGEVGVGGLGAIVLPALGGAIRIALEPRKKKKRSTLELGDSQAVFADETLARAAVACQGWIEDKAREPGLRRAAYREAEARFFLPAVPSDSETRAIELARSRSDAELEAALADDWITTPDLAPVRTRTPDAASLRRELESVSPVARVAAPLVLAHADGAAAEPIARTLVATGQRTLVRVGLRALSLGATDSALDALFATLAEVGGSEWVHVTEAIGRSRHPRASARIAERLAAVDPSTLRRLEGEVVDAPVEHLARLLAAAGARHDPSLASSLLALFDAPALWWLMPGITNALVQTGGPAIEARAQEIQLAMMGMGRALNQDHARRRVLLGLDPDEISGGIYRVGDFDAARVTQLIDEGFLAPQSQQNLGPPAGHILALLREWPELRAHGYAVSEERPDCRVTLDRLSADVSRTDPERADALRELLSQLGAQASSLELEDDQLGVWWT